MQPQLIIQILTICALGGLLFAVGLRLRMDEIIGAVRQCRLAVILILNFAVVPALAVVLARMMGLDRAATIAIILLAASPFAPVVPVFTRMARADLALAAGLTSFVTILSAFITPWACVIALKSLSGTGDVRLNVLTTLVTLVATIVLPMALGVWLRHVSAPLSVRLLRPVEVLAEGTGALSLAFVTVTEFQSILSTDWRVLVTMAVLSELCLLMGYLAGKGTRASRRVVALGTSNRNIALALLLAISNFANSPVVPGVVANGLLLIALGLVHVGIWRFLAPAPASQPTPSPPANEVADRVG